MHMAYELVVHVCYFCVVVGQRDQAAFAISR